MANTKIQCDMSDMCPMRLSSAGVMSIRAARLSMNAQELARSSRATHQAPTACNTKQPATQTPKGLKGAQLAGMKSFSSSA